jgi:hypothetical protein
MAKILFQESGRPAPGRPAALASDDGFSHSLGPRSSRLNFTVGDSYINRYRSMSAVTI